MRFVKISILVLALAVGATAQRAATVKQRSLLELTERADRIVHGYVVQSKVEPHPHYGNLSTVVVTMRVADTLKGPAAKELNFRQFIWDMHAANDNAGYRKGKELILFLNKVNEEGLTSPIGMDQGRMEVRLAEDGRRVVRPSVTNSTFTQGVETALRKRGKAMPQAMVVRENNSDQGFDLNDLKNVVRELARTKE
jgi:hypothetical protein